MKKSMLLLLATLLLSGICMAEVPLHGWKPHDEFNDYSVETHGDYIYALECGEISFGNEPPYRTTVYDLQENPICTVDGMFAQYYDENTGKTRFGLEDGYGVVWTGENENGIVWAIVSDKGELLIGDLTDASGFVGDYAYYSRSFGIPLLEKILQKLDFNIGFCGRIDKEGNRLELAGSKLNAPDELGYMVLQLHGWDGVPQDSDRFMYVDGNGKPAIDCVYERAYPFVDGAAVVKYEGKYMLIDPSGDMICEISRKWGSEVGVYKAFSAEILAADSDAGLLLINRRGEIINQTAFTWVSAGLMAFGDMDILICEDAEGISHFMSMDGETLAALPIENWSCGSDAKTIWVKMDGLWGMLDVQGIYGEPGSFASDDRYMDLELPVGQLPDGSWVTIGERGEALETAEAPEFNW